MGRLVLTRREQQRVIITVAGVEIAVLVAEIVLDKVKLIFEAPPEVVIHRKEVYDRLRAVEDRSPA